MLICICSPQAIKSKDLILEYVNKTTTMHNIKYKKNKSELYINSVYAQVNQLHKC